MARPVRLLVALLLSAAVLAATWGWYVAHPSLWPEYRQATALIAAIEQFKSSHGRLPADISQLPEPNKLRYGRVFYQATGQTDYEVWFGRSLGESYTYDSSSRS